MQIEWSKYSIRSQKWKWTPEVEADIHQCRVMILREGSKKREWNKDPERGLQKSANEIRMLDEDLRNREWNKNDRRFQKVRTR